MVAVGLIVSLVAAAAEASLSTALFAAGFLLEAGGAVLLATARRP